MGIANYVQNGRRFGDRKMLTGAKIPKMSLQAYLLPDICLLTGVLWCNLPTDAPYRGAPCRPVPSPKPRPEALVTRYRKLAFVHFVSLFALLSIDRDSRI